MLKLDVVIVVIQIYFDIIEIKISLIWNWHFVHIIMRKDCKTFCLCDEKNYNDENFDPHNERCWLIR